MGRRAAAVEPGVVVVVVVAVFMAAAVGFSITFGMAVSVGFGPSG